MEIIGIGIDIVSNKRLLGSKIDKRFLTKKEKKVFDLLLNEKKLEFLTGRWAAKESIIKASNNTISISEISILNNKDGKPEVFIGNDIQDEIKVTISHEKDFTVAFSIIVRV